MLSDATEKPSTLKGESSGLASPPELTREECVGESPGGPLLLAAVESCKAWQCKPTKNCTRGRRCTAPASWQRGKALLLSSAGFPSHEPSFLAMRCSPVSARFCASLRAGREKDPSRELVVRRPEIPVKVLPNPGGCKRVPIEASEQLPKRWHRPRDDPGTKDCFRRRFIKMEPAEDKITLEHHLKGFKTNK